ncbi:MAG: TerC family protein [Deltaproteobacteria bacterium]|nr:TerC family protein [Deltaproteobacteria bacterium]
MDAVATDLFTLQNLIALISLAALEIVLGIDNIVFIAIITSRLHRSQQAKMRRIGLVLAMLQRILLLFAIGWVVRLTDPLFTILDRGVSGRDLILIGGGLFLIAKATFEIHGTIEGGHEHGTDGSQSPPASAASILVQITLLDVVFSLDSVITAVGMVNNLTIMVAAVVASVAVMVLFANPVSEFIVKHPTIKMLALSFLLLIGVVLTADGTGHHVEKGYIYFAMGFSILVEAFNFRLRSKAKASAG